MPGTVTRETRDGTTTVTLRRPEARNALNGELIRELTHAFEQLAGDPDTRVVVLAAEGPAFCAGADLHWMREMVHAGRAENVADARALGRMYRTVYECPLPVVARVQGAAFGGGAGLVAACDLAVAREDAAFSFSEARLGLAPAVISPFVLRKLSPGAARRLFVTAERFSAEEAARLGLVSQVVATGEALDEAVAAWCAQLRKNGPQAMAACKRLVDEVAAPDWDEVLERMAERIADLRAGEEGQEGIRAFLEKREAHWSGLKVEG